MSRQDAINEVREVCTLLGCSGMSSDLCKNNPHLCDIIRKWFKESV